MSEGELKKRIRSKWFLPLEKDYMPIEKRLEEDELEGNAAIDYSDLTEILGEAAKEFPQTIKTESVIFKSENCIDETIVAALQKANKQMDWFKKWFGSSGEQP